MMLELLKSARAATGGAAAVAGYSQQQLRGDPKAFPALSLAEVRMLGDGGVSGRWRGRRKLPPDRSLLCPFGAGNANCPKKWLRLVDLCRGDLLVRRFESSQAAVEPCCRSCIPSQPCLNGAAAFLLLLLLLSITLRDFKRSGNPQYSLTNLLFSVINSNKSVF